MDHPQASHPNPLGLTGFVAWGVNDYGQAIGTGWNSDQTFLSAVLWDRLPDGKGWQLISLKPSNTNLPFTQAYSINDDGEIVGVSNSSDSSIWLPRFWKPLNLSRTKYSLAIVLPVPKGVFTNCENIGINELGDMVGDCWNDDYSVDLPARWTTSDLTFSKVVNFPANWGFAWGVNDSRIAAVTYTGGQICTEGIPWATTCGGATQLP